MNEQLKLSLNCENIATLTRDKVFKIEIKKWDRLPAIIVMFAQAWKVSMMRLNDDENRYLAELKDILLEKYFK